MYKFLTSLPDCVLPAQLQCCLQCLHWLHKCLFFATHNVFCPPKAADCRFPGRCVMHLYLCMGLFMLSVDALALHLLGLG